MLISLFLLSMTINRVPSKSPKVCHDAIIITFPQSPRATGFDQHQKYRFLPMTLARAWEKEINTHTATVEKVSDYNNKASGN